MRVVIIGGAGFVGTALCHRLLREYPSVEPIVCDVQRPAIGHVKWAQCDLVSGDVESVLREIQPEVVIHLAAQVDPPTQRQTPLTKELHIGGTQKLVDAVSRLSVKHFILCSSAVVYGARAENPVPLTEDSPRRPNEGFPYGEDKAAQEELVYSVLSKEMVTCLRPTVIYAPHAKNHLTEILRYSPGILPAIDGRRPPLQFVHVQDVAQAFCKALELKTNGIFNIGPVDHMTYSEVAHQAGLRVLNMPFSALKPVVNRLAEVLPARFRAPDYVIEHLSYPFVISSAKAMRELGYAPQFTTSQALEAMLQGKKRRKG